jgi:D-threo-aldose 1-dehydrogenase
MNMESGVDGAWPLGLGGAGLGNHLAALTDQQAELLLAEAWDAGVRVFDTAPHYGLGLSETRLGSFLSSTPREHYRLTTKVGRLLVPQANPTGQLDDEGFMVPADHRRVWDFSASGVRQSLEGSLGRLRTDHVDVVYVHDPERWDLTRGLEDGLRSLEVLRAEGVAGAIGVGSMDVTALELAARSGSVDELMIAGRYTLADQSAAETVLPACVANNVDVVAAAVFNGGLLAGSPTSGSQFDYAEAPPEVLERARGIEAVCAHFGVPMKAAALQFPLQHSHVRTVVVGAAEPGQISENVDQLGIDIPSEMWAVLQERELVVT